MTTKERFTRMYEHRDADRVPIVDVPWEGTLLRWKQEGMSANVDWRDFFEVDKYEIIFVDNSPRYKRKIIEENDLYVISTTEWGVTIKNFKVPDSTPEFLDYTVTTPEAWEKAKALMKPDRSRIDWDYLKTNFPKWKAEGRWIQGLFWFGFDVTHAWMSGFDTIIYALIEEPEWIKDIFKTFLDSSIALFDMIWEEGYHFDCVAIWDDMGYKGTTFFSNEIYAELLQPYHKKAIEWAHNHGIKAHLHSCGNVMQRIPQLVEIGLDSLNPIEIKAGMDIKALKRDYGDRLVLHGGADALYMDKTEIIIPFIEEIVPIVKEKGGYIFSSDHTIPNTVGLETYRLIVETVKKIGAY